MSITRGKEWEKLCHVSQILIITVIMTEKGQTRRRGPGALRYPQEIFPPRTLRKLQITIALMHLIYLAPLKH